MIKVYLPSNFTEERKYFIDVFFNWILKIPINIEEEPSENYRLLLPNGNSIEIIDQFFTKIKVEKGYLNNDSIPKNIFHANNKHCVDSDLPLFFGNDKLTESERGNRKQFVFHGDIFASAFFMLTRMEEYVNLKRDPHGRFEGKNSIAYKNGFLNRPIVNEYAEMLWNMMLQLGYDEGLRTNIGYGIIPTHDIDKVYYSLNIPNLLGDLFLDKSISRAYKRLALPKENYWDTFSWMMDVSEENNLKSIFYIMADSDNKNDSMYSLNDKLVQSKVEEIINRGHIIGVHPGYDSTENYEEWNRQKSLLEETVKSNITETRQHYLRFKFPDTIHNIEKAGVRVDSSLGFADKIGFRCGTSCEFPLFDLVNKRTTGVIERPLIIMDIILRDRKNTERSAEKAIETVEAYKETCKKYQIPLTILFHNSSFDPIRWNTWKEVYRNNFIP